MALPQPLPTRKKNLHAAWGIIILLALVDALWLQIKNLSIPANALCVAAVLVGTLAALAAVYTWLRPDIRLAMLTELTAQLTAYSISVGIFGYLMVTLDRPLIDDRLAALDRFAGFDWVAVYHWVFSHKIVEYILILSYDSVVPQIGLLMALMVTWRRYDRAQALLWLYIAGSLTYIIISGFLPAAGAFGYYKTALDTPYVQQFYALRGGSMQNLDIHKLQGVVQFPSFHFALAVICTYVTRGMRYMFPLFLVLNLAVIAATPAIGGHFFADLWVSAILIGVLIFGVEHCLASRQKALF